LDFETPYDVLVNQDGDLVVGTQASDKNWKLFKVTPNGSVTTFLTTFSLGRSAKFNGPIEINIDTGNYLVFDGTTQTTLMYPVLEVTPNGIVTTWSTGGGAGWANRYSAPQNHRNGHIEGPFHSQKLIYQLKKGTTSRTTLATLAVTDPILGASDFDLQTAAKQRWVAFGSSPGATHVYYIDRTSFTVTSTHVRKTQTTAKFIIFARGKHIQTEKLAQHKWKIWLSCPRFPNRKYRLVGGLSGVRPGVPVSDGRNINLNVDAITYATLNNSLPGIWNPGPGILDAKGGAEGQLDLSLLSLPPSGLGIPFWIAMAVLDPKAPSGIAYLPDTFVMRL